MEYLPLCTIGLLLGYHLVDVVVDMAQTVKIVRHQYANNRIRRELGMTEKKVTWRV